jgi:hypothetical protein
MENNDDGGQCQGIGMSSAMPNAMPSSMPNTMQGMPMNQMMGMNPMMGNPMMGMNPMMGNQAQMGMNPMMMGMQPMMMNPMMGMNPMMKSYDGHESHDGHGDACNERASCCRLSHGVCGGCKDHRSEDKAAMQ